MEFLYNAYVCSKETRRSNQTMVKKLEETIKQWASTFHSIQRASTTYAEEAKMHRSLNLALVKCSDNETWDIISNIFQGKIYK
jgi:hypothetical protein